jgi:hypothetical protein
MRRGKRAGEKELYVKLNLYINNINDRLSISKIH